MNYYHLTYRILGTKEFHESFLMKNSAQEAVDFLRELRTNLGEIEDLVVEKLETNWV